MYHIRFVNYRSNSKLYFNFFSFFTEYQSSTGDGSTQQQQQQQSNQSQQTQLSVWKVEETSLDGCTFLCPQLQSFNTSLPHQVFANVDAVVVDCDVDDVKAVQWISGYLLNGRASIWLSMASNDFCLQFYSLTGKLFSFSSCSMT